MKKKLKIIFHYPYLLYKKLKYRKLYRKYGLQIIKELNNINNELIKVWYFCVPVHENLGDLAQRYCIENWLNQHYKNFHVINMPTMGIYYLRKKIIQMMKGKINAKDIIIFQSGYTMSDYHPDDFVRKLIFNNFKNNKIIVFPQTILYNSKKKASEMKNSMQGIKKLVFLSRDGISQKYAKEQLEIKNAKCYPDIVTSLIGCMNFNNKRKGICLCLRNDGEKYYSKKTIEKLCQNLKKIDKVNITDTSCSSLNIIEHSKIEKAIFRKIFQFSKYRVIITDRYHGTIFSLISCTPVVVIKTNDHKVSSGVKWFKGVYDKYVYYCDNINDVPKIVKEIFNLKFDYKLNRYFKKEYYDKLK